MDNEPGNTSEQLPPEQPISSQAPPSVKPARKKRLKTTLLVIVALSLLGFAVWFLWFRNTGSNTGAELNQDNQSPSGYLTETEPSKLNPFAVTYAYREGDEAPYELFWRPVGGGDRVSALKLNADNFVTDGRAKGPYTYVATDGSDGSDGSAIWLSSDGGKSYEKIFSGQAGTESVFGDQITSVIFSNDSKRLLVAVLGPDGKNTIKEISTATKETKDLFSVDSPGVFLTYYDSAKLKLYYSTGCYNCDGNTGFPFLLRDVVSGEEKTLFSSDDKYRVETAIKDDLSEILYVQGSMGDGLGSSFPYQLLRYSQASEQTTTVEENVDSISLAGGYSKEHVPYYFKDSMVYDLAKKSLIFDAEQPIQRVHFMSKDLLVVSSGSFDNYHLATYDMNTKKATSILSGDINTFMFGVTEL